MTKPENKDLLKDLAPAAPRKMGHCVYCGWLCRGRVCSAHRDLPKLEEPT